MFVVIRGPYLVGVFTDLERAHAAAKKCATSLMTTSIFQYQVNTSEDNCTLIAEYTRGVSWKNPVCWPKRSASERSPIEQFAYTILEGDPIAIDAAQDVLAGKR